MKKLIVPIAIVAALSTFLYLIDRKDFYRYDDVRTGQGSINETQREPAYATMVETKPVAETKPAETKPTQARPSSSAAVRIASGGFMRTKRVST